MRISGGGHGQRGTKWPGESDGTTATGRQPRGSCQGTTAGGDREPPGAGHPGGPNGLERRRFIPRDPAQGQRDLGKSVGIHDVFSNRPAVASSTGSGPDAREFAGARWPVKTIGDLGRLGVVGDPLSLSG